MFYVILTVHMILCATLVFLVLLQQGKGADMGATLGGGSNTVFGAGGATNLITRVTTGAAILFMVTSILLVRTFGTLKGQSVVEPNKLEGSLVNQLAVAPDEGKSEENKGEDTAAGTVVDRSGVNAPATGEASGDGNSADIKVESKIVPEKVAPEPNVADSSKAAAVAPVAPAPLIDIQEPVKAEGKSEAKLE